nr:NAD(P)-binding Rossmann-fold superfamily protein [Tanacetum cinerariifolium]
ILWRVVAISGIVQVERGNKDDRHGYVVTLFSAKGETTSTFYPFSGVTDEVKAFLSDVLKSTLQMVGCEVASVSAMTSHVDTALPPPDSISSIL